MPFLVPVCEDLSLGEVSARSVAANVPSQSVAPIWHFGWVGGFACLNYLAGIAFGEETEGGIELSAPENIKIQDMVPNYAPGAKITIPRNSSHACFAS